MINLPEFIYHPDPLKTGSIIESSKICQCCDHARGFIYSLTIYARGHIEHICPWCIASGDAATKFAGSFVDDHTLTQLGLAKEIIEEVCLRTPSYVSWQSESWLACCHDACAFYGDATREDLLNLGQDGIEELLESAEVFSIDDLRGIIATYEPAGSPAFYKFICRHCRKVKYHVDYH